MSFADLVLLILLVAAIFFVYIFCIGYRNSLKESAKDAELNRLKQLKKERDRDAKIAKLKRELGEY